MKLFAISAACIVLCLATGFIASRFQLDALANWYPQLNKSPLTPPNWAFPLAWSVLYVCMGLSIALVVVSGTPDAGYFIKLFTAQLFFNFIWSFAFFYYQNPLAGLVVIAILLVLIALYTMQAFALHRVSALLFIPYVLWVGFASYLNLYIVLRN